MNTSLKKTLIEGVIAELVQFSVHSKKKKTTGIFAVSLQLLCETSYAYKVSGEYIIKKRRPEVTMHIKISGEYVIKKH